MLTEILTKLVQFPTVTSDKTASFLLFDYLELTLSKNLNVIRHHSDGFPSLVATTTNTKKPKVMLQSHMDVVPADDEAFKLLQKDGRIYGRGVYDMKFAAACYLQLIEDLQDEIDKYDFGLMLTSDEEVGGENGVGYLLDKGYSADVCILPDGGNDWAIETGCHGIWMVQLIAEGKTSHGSRPWEGDNAINKLIDVLSVIRGLFGDCKPNENSLNIGQIGGGKAINQVPGRAEANLDMRFVDQKEYARLRIKIEDITKSAGIRIETIVHTAGCHTDIKNPYVASFIKISEDVRGKKMETCHSFGSTDARFFNEHDIPTIVIRPVGGGHHSDAEWIDEASLNQFYEVLKAYVIKTARIQ